MKKLMKFGYLLSMLLVVSSCGKNTNVSNTESTNDSLSIETVSTPTSVIVEQSDAQSVESSVSENTTTSEINSISETTSVSESTKQVEFNLTTTGSAVKYDTNEGARNSLASVFGSYVSKIEYYNVFEDFGAIKFGSQKEIGSLTFSFTKEIKQVIVSVRTYSKYDTYNKVYSIDTESKVSVNKEEKSITIPDNAESEFEDVTFDVNSSSMLLASVSGRIIVNKLTIIY